MMHWTDVGVNLTATSLAAKATEVVADAQAASVTRLVLIGTSVTESERAAELAQQFSGCISTAGIHPHDAAQAADNFQNHLVQLFAQEQVRAVGECGLDYNRNYSPPDVQRKIFAAQLELAAELQLPVYLHER